MKETREHILKIAYKLFLSKSYKEVTMKEIVEKTKLSKGAFYHYFSSKENLFNEVIDTYYLSTTLLDYNQYSKDSLHDFFHQYIDNVGNYLVKLKRELDFSLEFDFFNYYFIMFDAFNHFPGFKEKIFESYKKEGEAWERIVHIAREKGEIKSSMSDKQIAKIFISISDGVGITSILYGRIDTLIIEITELWEKFYETIKN
jgi:TetR/AcrR family transcriptional regulator, transcriptional repressor for nem operon